MMVGNGNAKKVESQEASQEVKKDKRRNTREGRGKHIAADVGCGFDKGGTQSGEDSFHYPWHPPENNLPRPGKL